MNPAHGLIFDDSRFWVVHRHQRYGPFDYEWSKDFCGMEFTYGGRKFGEYCSDDEIFADLAEFQLPRPVVAVGTIVCGTIVRLVLEGSPRHERAAQIEEVLLEFGYGRFLSPSDLSGWDGTPE
ncbi:MAG: hypothetical protein KDA79_09100 [Planctomycetaceae bacterium]|nr:hypothetical protein [Planctomycetaceae bacterium]